MDIMRDWFQDADRGGQGRGTQMYCLYVEVSRAAGQRRYAPEGSPARFTVYERRRGNSITSRIDALSVSTIVNLSMPIPSPAVGGNPYSRAII
jgi:hypothetical protein